MEDKMEELVEEEMTKKDKAVLALGVIGSVLTSIAAATFTPNQAVGVGLAYLSSFSIGYMTIDHIGIDKFRRYISRSSDDKD
jgi:drug/metabolite transporter (DMT)-like permease